MIAFRTPALIDAARAATLLAGELGHRVQVQRVHAQDGHGWAVLAPNRAALEVFAHVLPYLALEVWPRSGFNREDRV